MDTNKGVFVRNNLLPQADMSIDNLFPQGQVIYGPVGQVLSYVVTNGPDAPHWLRSDRSGNLLTYSNGGFETLPQAQVINLVPPRTDTTTTTITGIALPPFTVAVITVTVTAVSGTTPSMTCSIASIDSQGVYHNGNGGGSFGAITTTTSTGLSFGGGNVSTQATLGAIVRLTSSITGTTPSFTYYVDMTYK